MITRIITPFSGNGLTAETAYRPAVADVYPFAKLTDVTGLSASEIIPAPNLYVIEVEVDMAILAALETDPDYFVLWSE